MKFTNRGVLIALKMAVLCGIKEQNGYDFGFGADSDFMCENYIKWAFEIQDCYGKEDYYNTINNKINKELKILEQERMCG